MAMFILLALLLLFSILGVPICYGVGMSSITYLTFENPQFIAMLPQRVWSGSFSFLMICMPMFILAGELMNTGGITKRIFDFCMEILRPIRGGLAEVNVIDSMLFGGISGSSVADTSATGSIMIPAMEKAGYPKKFTAGLTVATSTMGMIIPPSIPMIVFSMVSGASIGGLFLAGLIPGIFVGVVQFIFVYVLSAKRGYHPEYRKFDKKTFFKAFFGGLPALLMPVIIIITVSTGIATASESAAIAVAYSLIMGLFVYKELDIKGIIQALRKTLIATSSIMLIIGYTMIFTWILTVAKVPQAIGAFFMESTLPVWVLLIFFVILILLIGTFVDVTPAILLLVPVLLPVMRQFGISDLQFGAIMITGLAIGLCTPPVGMCLNACSKINGMPIVDIFKGAAPFLICNVFVLVMITFIPEVSTWLPSILM